MARRRARSSAASSAEAPDTLLASPLLAYTGAWLRDGSALVTTAADLQPDPSRPDSTLSGPGTDAVIVRNAGKGPLQPLVASRFNESYVGVSPDGRWISFVSDQSGREEVYVRDLAGELDQVLVSFSQLSRRGRRPFTPLTLYVAIFKRLSPAACADPSRLMRNPSAPGTAI